MIFDVGPTIMKKGSHGRFHRSEALFTLITVHSYCFCWCEWYSSITWSLIIFFDCHLGNYSKWVNLTDKLTHVSGPVRINSSTYKHASAWLSVHATCISPPCSLLLWSSYIQSLKGCLKIWSPVATEPSPLLVGHLVPCSEFSPHGSAPWLFAVLLWSE